MSTTRQTTGQTAPKKLGRWRSTVHGAIADLDARTFTSSDGRITRRLTWSDESVQEVASGEVDTWTRLPDEPEPAAIDSVDWAAVHRGEVVPPERVDVPKLYSSYRGRAVVCVNVKGETMLGASDVPPDAAHYTIDGHLTGYRTAEGWKQVHNETARDGAGDPALPAGAAVRDERAESSPKSPTPDEGSTPRPAPTPDPYAAAESHERSIELRKLVEENTPSQHAIAQDMARRRAQHEALTYLRTGERPGEYGAHQSPWPKEEVDAARERARAARIADEIARRVGR